ncbi:MAG: InlB B-repeat-containing protein, partial [Kiritimatiellae bacterium]|nr:InlB B-repeat-containing protein [Kiritimatiellia bacterium]
MKKFATGLMLGLMCLAVAAVSLAENYALCTGLNTYDTNYVDSDEFLNGCVPDAMNVYTNIILRGEWTAANSTLFTNAQGTFAAVSNQLMSFASTAASGDVVLYYHSSHGYQDSGKDTGICMYDDDMPDSSFAKILANFRSGVKVVIVLDTCHSGGMFKSLRRDGTTRTLDRGSPFAFARRVNEELAAIRADEAARGIKAAKLAVNDCAWVTAADYDQYSWDGDEGGAFTECYIGSVKSGACDESPYGNGDSYATFKEMFDYAVAQDETHGDGDPDSEDYTMPQCTNTTVLAAVRFGWVGEAREGFAVATDELPPAMEGVAYEAELEASGGTAPYAWSVAPGNYEEESQAGSFCLTGDGQGWQGDDECWTLQLPFAFPFFGNAHPIAKINSNGTISFGDDVSAYNYDEDLFLGTPMIAVLWKDLNTSGGDIYVEGDAESVKVTWNGTYYGGGDVNFAATLAADGEIRLSYGDGNGSGGFIGISAGDGETTLVSGLSDNGSMDWADDIVFAPQGLPAGMELTEGGVLQGTPEEAGIYGFTVLAADAAGEEASQSLELEVAANPALRPVVEETTPEEGYVNMGTARTQSFTVDATREGDGALTYDWSVDGVPVDGWTAATYRYTRTDDALHTVSCTVGAADLPKSATVTWRAGVLTVDGPADATVSMGATVVLRVDVTSSLDVDVTWFDEIGEDVAYGETLVLRDVQESGTYHAVAESALGTVESRTATVTVTTAPSVGRIYKLTGAPFLGNRLVLRAKAYGNLTGAAYSWKRDGVQVGTSERLDIASLGAGDFGTYTLTVTTPEGSATSEAFELAEAPIGVPVGWGAHDHGRTEAPAGESGFVQVASGMNFNLGLKADGTVVAWGYNGHGGCDVQEGLSGVSSVAAGGYQSQGAGFAVKTDGSVVAWGMPHQVEGHWDERWVNDYDENGNWIGSHPESYWQADYTNGWDTVSTIPSDLSDVVQVAVGSQFAMALKSDGTVAAWGATNIWHYDEEGNWVLGDFAPPEDLEDVVAIAAGGRFALVLTADGSVTAWGDDSRAEDYGFLDVPEDLADVVAVAATKGEWSASAGFALEAGGTVAKWGDNYDYTDFESGTETDAVAIDAGQEFFVALDGDGTVTVWNWWNDYGICDVPSAVQGNAIAIAAGGYHCTALLLDTDGDSIADAEETLLGRDPEVWEPWERTTLEGAVLVGGGAPEYGVEICLLDAAGNVRAWAEADENGAWSMDGIIPGVYVLQLSAPDAVDAETAVSTLSGSEPLSIDLEPGQGTALAEVVAHEAPAGESCGEDCTPVELPAGTTVYLDMWPAETDADGKLDLGEVAASHCALDGTTRLAHLVTVKRPEAGAQIPVPDWVAGEEGATVEANPHFCEESGSLRVATVPAGAEVWVDYADESLGVTPLTLTGLSAAASHAHVLLLKKDGYLRPRPIEFTVEAGETTEIELELEDGAEDGLTVTVDSAVAGMDIYLDYLPTGLTTPATVSGLGTDEYWEELWHSASHSILLKGPGMRPVAARAAEAEWEYDEETDEWNLPAVELNILSPTMLARNPDNIQRVRFDLQGGTCGTAAMDFSVGGTYAGLPAATKAGVAFLGWFTAADGGTQVTANTTVTTAAVRTLYAHWTDKQVTTFDGNGGTPSVQVVTNTVGTKYGELPAVSRAKHVFQGWYDASEGGTRVTANTTVTQVSKRTLYAHWTDRQATTFRWNDGTTNAVVRTNTMGQAYGTMPAPKWAGHAFLGWFTASNGGSEVKGTNTVTVTTKRTLYAHWTDKQVTTFDGNGGTPSTQVATNTVGTKYGELPAVWRANHVFQGWYDAAEGGTRVTANTTVTQVSKRTLYAHWTDRQATTFRWNDGTTNA